ncbi:MAG: anthranilate synthase component I [Clostridiales bacterium]|nr:anthranilate synthase component I [Clostridiales bacterium]
MEFFPAKDEMKAILSGTAYKCAPVRCEIMSDLRTPIEVLKIIKGLSSHAYILESVENQERWGRFTFLGYDPTLDITYKDRTLTISGTDRDETIETDDPGKYMREILAEYKSPVIDGMPSFTGGLVGYFAYDYIKHVEKTLDLECVDEGNFKDCDLMLFDKVIAFDNLKQKIVIVGNVRADDVDNSYDETCKEIEKIAEIIKNGTPIDEPSGRLLSEVRPLFDKESYCAMVEKAKYHIKEGDIFQIVLSNRLEADYEGSMLNVYRVLRTLNPSPYMFYFSGTDVEVAGASPETLVKLENGKLYTFPLAGTRPRGKTYEEDQALEADLLADEKELAEHNMLVDLGRNDIGKIAKFGTVEVMKYHSIERFSHVMHIGSTVRGEIRDDKDAFDAIDAILPAGTLSGAPKIKACQLINELERNKRGIYGGAIGYIDFGGNLDTCIAIRLAYKKNGKIYVRSGAGIVYDSVPEKEYQECINKAAAVVKAIEGANEL